MRAYTHTHTFNVDSILLLNAFRHAYDMSRLYVLHKRLSRSDISLFLSPRCVGRQKSISFLAFLGKIESFGKDLHTGCVRHTSHVWWCTHRLYANGKQRVNPNNVYTLYTYRNSYPTLLNVNAKVSRERKKRKKYDETWRDTPTKTNYMSDERGEKVEDFAETKRKTMNWKQQQGT